MASKLAPKRQSPLGSRSGRTRPLHKSLPQVNWEEGITLPACFAHTAHQMERILNLSRIPALTGLVGFALAGCFTGVHAEDRPTAGSISQNLPRQSHDGVPKAVAPEVSIPAPPPRAHMESVVKFVPSGFKFSGNSLIPSSELLALEPVAAAIGKEIDFVRLADLADQVREHYRKKKYPLTDVYFPEQEFDQKRGVVEFVVVEARRGKVIISEYSEKDVGISKGQAQSIAEALVPEGAYISEDLIYKQVLLLRDMIRSEAQASVTLQPGTNVGEVDIKIEFKGEKPYKAVEASVAADNLGTQSTGSTRTIVQASLERPLGIGDQLQVRLQGSSMQGNHLYRVGYSVPVGPYATKLIGSLSRNTYVLGGEFRDLNASGYAKVTSGSVVQPVWRGRFSNLMLVAGVDRKQLYDRTGASDPQSEVIDTARFGLLGSFSDSEGYGNNTFSFLMTEGKSSFAAGDPVLNSKGRFSKINLDFQSTRYLSELGSLMVNFSGQVASKNLRNSERISYGGPQAVRGYKGPSGTGDEGLMGSIEYRYLLPFPVFDSKVTASVFFDSAVVQFRANPVTGISRRNAAFDSVGLGLRAGREGKFVGSFQVAVPVSSTTGGIDQTVSVTEDRDPKYWLNLQVWFPQ